jgi:hypothetical protein
MEPPWLASGQARQSKLTKGQPLSAFHPAPQPEREQGQRRGMEQQVKDINGAYQVTAKQHPELFKQMGLRCDRRDRHPQSQPDKQGQWNSVQPVHGVSSSMKHLRS